MGERVAHLVAARLDRDEHVDAIVLGLNRNVRRVWLALWPVWLLVVATIDVFAGRPAGSLFVPLGLAYVVGASLAAGDRALRLVVVTDRAVVVFAARFAPTLRPTRVLCRLPRSTSLHGRRRLTIDLDLGERILVSRRFQRTLDGVDRAVRADPADRAR